MAPPKLRERWNERALEAALASKQVNARDAEGITPLWHAVYFGRAEWVVRLLGAGATLDGHDPARVARAVKGLSPWTRLPAHPHAVPTGTGTLLHVAAAHVGSPEVAGVLLEKGVAVDARDPFGCTALHVAAFHRHAPFAEVLLSAGADVDALDATAFAPLDHGAFHHDVLKLLLARGADPNGGPRMPEKGRWKPEDLSVVTRAAEAGHVDVLSALLKAGVTLARHPDALALAALHRRADVVKFLLAHGAPTAVTTTWRGEDLGPLSAAAWTGSLTCVELLWPTCGAEAAAALAATITGSGWDDAGAGDVRAERKQLISWLVAQGADPRDGVIAAAGVTDPTYAALLFEKGAPGEVVDAFANSALAHAAQRSAHRVVELLLAHGANPLGRAGDGRTAYAIAEEAYRTRNVDDARLVMRAIDAAGGGPAPAPEAPAEPSVGPTVGRIVSHGKFGDGEVLAIDGEKLTIAFEGGDKRVLLARFVTVRH